MKTLKFAALRCFLLVLALAGPAHCVESLPREVSLPSEKPSGNLINDQIWFSFYAARMAGGQRAPAVVLLHPLGGGLSAMHQAARIMAGRGLNAAVVELPYHFRRFLRGEPPLRRFVASDPDVVLQAFEQSVADVSTVVGWLGTQPGVDPNRIGAVGISLGAIVVHLAMGQDERISAGVALLGGGDLLDIYRSSPARRLFIRQRAPSLGPQIEEKLRRVDPLEYAGNHQPRRVLMVQAARDSFIPPRAGEKLWKALGRPPIQWIDTNHLAIVFAVPAATKTAIAYLQNVWSGQPLAAVPRVKVPTIKAGVVLGLDSIVSPAIVWQFFSFAQRRDHMSLLHADVGLTTRGPFIGLAATLNAFADIGVGRRLNGRKIRPYASLHFVF